MPYEVVMHKATIHANVTLPICTFTSYFSLNDEGNIGYNRYFMYTCKDCTVLYIISYLLALLSECKSIRPKAGYYMIMSSFACSCIPCVCVHSRELVH